MRLNIDISENDCMYFYELVNTRGWELLKKFVYEYRLYRLIGAKELDIVDAVRRYEGMIDLIAKCETLANIYIEKNKPNKENKL